MKVLFLIRSMDYGGTERQLVILAKGMQARGHDVVIAVFYAGGPLEQELREAGIRIVPLHKRSRWDVLMFFWRLMHVVQEERPDVIHGLLSDANLVALALKPRFPSIRLVWGVRGSTLDFSRYDWIDRVSFKLNCWLAACADAIIVNSRVGREYHLAMGYPKHKTILIPNGIDTDHFRADPSERCRIRSEWGVRDDERLIGLVGRLDPMKDHPVFLEAASVIARRRSDVRFVCVGEGPREYQNELQTLSERIGLAGRVVWAGARKDMPSVYNALDCLVSCSYGEGLSNVIGEAMACGVPCVVTDVGDSAWVVGNQGEVVPPKTPGALVEALQKVLNKHPGDPDRIRQRVVDKLSVSSLLTTTERVLKALLQDSLSSAFGQTRARPVR